MSGSGANVAAVSVASLATISCSPWCSTLTERVPPVIARDGPFQAREVRYFAFAQDGSRLGEERGTSISARLEASTWRRTLDPIASARVLSEVRRRGGGRAAGNRRRWPRGGRSGERMDLDVCLRRCHHDLDACRLPGCRAMAGKSDMMMARKSDMMMAGMSDMMSAAAGTKAGRAVMEQRRMVGGGNVVPDDDREQVTEGHDPVPLSASLRTGVAGDGASGSQSWSHLRVGYQGVPGAYSEAAAHLAYPDCQAVPCDQFDATFQAVEQWAVDRAVLPIENSLGGSIHRNYDLLLRHRLHIVGEVMVDVHHCLLVLPGVKMEDVKKVVSHPQALAQCERTLTSLLGAGIVREAVDDTAGAAKQVAQDKLRDTAAVASSRAGEIYGLAALADGIQDNADNITRFIALAREPLIPHIGTDYKTSIVFTLEEGPGVLFKALAVFALRGINLSKIESRPQRNRPIRTVREHFNGDPGSAGGTASAAGAAAKGHANRAFDYLFYVDFQASMAEPRAQNALRNLEEFAPFLRVLGSYPASI